MSPTLYLPLLRSAQEDITKFLHEVMLVPQEMATNTANDTIKQIVEGATKVKELMDLDSQHYRDELPPYAYYHVCMARYEEEFRDKSQEASRLEFLQIILFRIAFKHIRSWIDSCSA